jgi:hypothetical protein
MVGKGKPEDTLRTLLGAGAQTIVLRRGENGAVGADVASGEAWTVPAVPSIVAVDTTGGGVLKFPLSFFVFLLYFGCQSLRIICLTKVREFLNFSSSLSVFHFSQHLSQEE